MSSRRDTDLEPLLEELERTLGDLRSELASDARRRPPRPPRVSELLRFTESYTIPTVIAVLEATIRSLELLRQLLRLADPERTLGRAGNDALRSQTLATDVGRDAVDRVTRSLEELQRALTEADLPPDADARSIVEDARSLSAEIEQRLSDGDRRPAERRATERSGGDAADDRHERSREPTGHREESGRGIRIDVTDSGPEPAGESGDEAGDEAAVDVEAELQSIKEELDAGDGPPQNDGEPSDDGGATSDRGTTSDEDDEQP
jgi:hypothetical protein